MQFISDKSLFAVISGLASVLGFLLAVYPVQIRNIEPSVFRGLLWEKSLFWAAGIGLAVFSSVQIYLRPPPDPDSFPGQIYDLLGMSGKIGQFTSTSFSMANLTPAIELGSPADPAQGFGIILAGGGNTNVGGSERGVVGAGAGVTIQGGFNGFGAGGFNNLGVTRGGSDGGRSADHPSHGSTFWFYLLLVGLLLIVVGYTKNPFLDMLYRLERLDREMENRRQKFVSKLTNASDVERSELIQAYDRDASLTRAALFFMLTGYRLNSPLPAGFSLSSSDLHAFYRSVVGEQHRPKVHEGET